MGYERLEKSLTDTIKEEQAKLGFRKEAIRLYYPLSSLNHFFDVQEGEEQMLHRLQHLPETWQEKLGDVGVTAKKERFCFYIPEQGSVYVHEHEKPDEFIRELVELVGRHGCTMQEIRELFCKHSSHVECQKIENGEFDWMFRFAEDEEDPYYLPSFFAGGLQGVWSLMKTDTGKAADQQGENYGTDNITFSYKPG